jgi:uncharacterized damage-inducible protein DinB
MLQEHNMTRNTFTESVAKILERDLTKVIQEINQFAKDEDLWLIRGSAKNPAGNLALHMAGAVNHFIGVRLGNSNYQRNRDLEFAARNISRENITKELQSAIDVVNVTMASLAPSDLDKEFPEQLGSATMTIQHFLLHLVSHVNYHLGQLNYVRRLCTE